MIAIVEVSIVPIGTTTTSLSGWVKNSFSVLKGYPNLKYELTAMGTIIEGDLDEVLKAVRDLHETPFKAGIKRVITRISIDDRRDKPSTIHGKVNSVMKKLSE